MRCPKCSRENKEDAKSCIMCYTMLINPKDKKKPLPPPIPTESTVEKEEKPVSLPTDEKEINKEPAPSESSKSSIVNEKNPESSVVKEEKPMSSVIKGEEQNKPALSDELPKSPIVDKEKSESSIIKEEKDSSPVISEGEQIAKSPLLAKILKSLFADSKKSKSSNVEEEKEEIVNSTLLIELSDLPVIDKEKQKSPIIEEEKPASPVVKEAEPIKPILPIESSEPTVVKEKEKPVSLGINEGEQSSPTVPIEFIEPSAVNEKISVPLVEDEEKPAKGEKGFIGTWWAVISSPVTFFDKMPESGGFSKPYLFALVNMLIAGLVAFFVTLAGGGQIRKFLLETFQVREISGPFLWILLGMILLIFAVSGSLKLFIQSVILNIFAKLLKGKGNYEGTFRVIAYTSSVNVFILIPMVNFLSLLYGLFILVIGIKKVNNFSVSRAILNIFLFVDIVILGVVLFFLFS